MVLAFVVAAAAVGALGGQKVADLDDSSSPSGPN